MLTACGSSRIAPLEIGPARLAIEQALQTINTGIVTKDVILASQQVHYLFKMDSNIALRYSDDPWVGTFINDVEQGQTDFREFFASALKIHANIFHSLVLTDLELTGDIATARVETVFNTTRSDKIPPEGFAAEGIDVFIFLRVAGSWMLIAWDEAPEPPEHNEGVFEDI